ncbi:hypothetical protein QLQ12_24955 [Actinoplanes sp. NEAU-A12]|uniref:Uncharacterized protein n=1 Tax=Actinoplanes sandaracinus TaxID=3045177 RepID=A0ABT6WQ65_9ACTN|nr:hypothetical protein [Actinoplanes sandaracinus]MDI6101873.1 hypothetical protein [Actinoplanes sandaracinus]
MRVFRTILGMLALTTGLPTLLAGGGLWAVMQHRDPGGAFSGELQRLTVPGYAVVIPDVDRLLRDDAPFARVDGTELRLSAITVDGRAFVGLAPSDEVARYLAGVPYSRVDAVDIGTGALPVTTSNSAGRQAPAGPPTQQSFWTTSGSGQLSLHPGELGDRPYSLVLMNPGGAPVVRLAAVAEVRPGWLNTGTWGLLTLGTLLAMAGVIILVWPGRRREVVYVVEPSQVPELMHAIGAPLPLPGGVAYFAGGRPGGAHRPRTLADSRPARPPALPQFAWPPTPHAGAAELPAGAEPATSLSTATLTGTLPADANPAYLATGSPVGAVPGSPATGSPVGVIPGFPSTGSAGDRGIPGSPATGPLVGAAIPGGETSGGTPAGAPGTTPGGLTRLGTGTAQTSAPSTPAAQMSAAQASAAQVSAADLSVPQSSAAQTSVSQMSAPQTSVTAPAGTSTAGMPSPGTLATAGGPAGAHTPAPGRPLSLLGETPALAGLPPGQVPARRGERRHAPAVTDLPEFQATAVGAWVAATAPERARQTEARAAARLAEAARRNAGKFAPTQAGSRNMPGTSRIPIAAPRRDTGENPADAQPETNPSDVTTTAQPAKREPITPDEASAATTVSSRSPEREASTVSEASAGTSVSGRAGVAAATPAKVRSSKPAAANSSSAQGEEIPEPGKVTAKVTADRPQPPANPDVVRANAPKPPATDARPHPAQAEPAAGEPAVAEPVVTRVVVHTGPAVTDWAATATTRVGLSHAPRQPAPTGQTAPAAAPAQAGSTGQAVPAAPAEVANRAGGRPSPKPPTAGNRIATPAPGAVTAPAVTDEPTATPAPLRQRAAGGAGGSHRQDGSGVTGTGGSAAVVSPPEWPPVGEPADNAVPVREKAAEAEKPADKDDRASQKTATSVDSPASPATAGDAGGRSAGKEAQAPKGTSPEKQPIVPFPSRSVGSADDESGRAPVTAADGDMAAVTDESRGSRASIHAVEAAIPVLDQPEVTPNAASGQPGAVAASTPDQSGVAPASGRSRRSMHTVEAQGLQVLPNKPAPVPTQGSAAPAPGDQGEPAHVAPPAGEPALPAAESQAAGPESASQAVEPEKSSRVAGPESALRTAEPKPKPEPRPGSRAAESASPAAAPGTASRETEAETKGDGNGRARKATGVKAGNDHPLARAQSRTGGKAAPVRPAPAARRAPAAWIKAAESMAARTVGEPGGETAPAVPRKGRSAANPKPAAEAGPAGPEPETAGNRPLSYREEAAELLAATAAGDGERRRRRTVGGRNRPTSEPQGGTDAGRAGNGPQSTDGGRAKSDPRGAGPDRPKN